MYALCMRVPGVLESAEQVAADIFPADGRSLGNAISIALSCLPRPLRRCAIGQQPLLKLGRCFLQL